MNELVFPIAAAAVVFFVIIPVLTIVSRFALRITRKRAKAWANYGSETTFALLVGPTIIPLVWFISSVFHQSEPANSETCLIDHVTTTTCTDALLLLGLLSFGMVLSAGHRLWRELPGGALASVDANHPSLRRVLKIVGADKGLAGLRVVVVRHSSEPIYTHGLLRPIVVIDACFIRDSDAAVLHAALLHEHAHICGFDTLRSFVVRLCLSMNPSGALLINEFRRWRDAREAVCDSEAVQRGGEPLALAEGIVRAAKFRCGGLAPGAVALGGDNMPSLRLRLALLMNGPPAPTKTSGHRLLFAAVLFVLIVPHISGFELLDHFHYEVERLTLSA